MKYVIGLACLLSACVSDWSEEINLVQAKEITAKFDRDAYFSKTWDDEVKQLFFVINNNSRKGKSKAMVGVVRPLCNKMVAKITTLGYQIDEVTDDSLRKVCYINFSW